MNLSEFNSPLPKPWLNIQAQSLTCESLFADTAEITDMVIDNLEAKVLVLDNQLSVPNPAVGSMALFTDAGNQILTSTDPLGVTKQYFQNNSSVDLDMGSHSITNFDSLLPAGDVLFGNSIVDNVPGGNVIIGNNTFASNTNVVCVGTGCSVNCPQGIAVGSGSSTGTNNFSLVVGRASSATGGGDVVLGTGTSSSAGSCVVIGSQAVGAGTNSVSVGRQSNCTNGGTQEIAIGFQSTCSNFASIALGAPSNASGNVSISIGGASTASGDQGIALGSQATASATESIAIGYQANNSQANSCQLGNGGTLNIKPGGNNSCDLGVDVTNRFNNVYCNSCLVGSSNRPADVGLFSQYTDVNVDNTTTETSVATGSAVGSLNFNPSPLGAMFDFSLSFLASSVAGDNLDIRWYSNAGLLFTNNLTIPALASNLPVTICTKAIVRNGNLYVTSTSEISGLVATIVSNAIVYDRTVNNLWDVTAQWGANVNQLSNGMFNVRASYSGTS